MIVLGDQATGGNCNEGNTKISDEKAVNKNGEVEHSGIDNAWYHHATDLNNAGMSPVKREGVAHTNFDEARNLDSNLQGRAQDDAPRCCVGSGDIVALREVCQEDTGQKSNDNAYIVEHTADRG